MQYSKTFPSTQLLRHNLGSRTAKLFLPSLSRIVSFFSLETKAKLNTVKSIVHFLIFFSFLKFIILFMKTVIAQDSVVYGEEGGSPLVSIRPPLKGEGSQLASFFFLFVFCCKTKHEQPLSPTEGCWLNW